MSLRVPAALALASVALFGACTPFDVLGYEEDVFEKDSAVGEDDPLADDRIEDKHPQYDPSYTVEETFGGCEVRLDKSGSITKLDVVPYADGDPFEGALYPGYAQALAAIGDRPTVPSMELLDASLKPFVDGLYAAVELGANDGSDGSLVAKRQLFLDLLGELVTRSSSGADAERPWAREAAVTVGVAADLAGDPVPPELAGDVAALESAFSGRLVLVRAGRLLHVDAGPRAHFPAGSLPPISALGRAELRRVRRDGCGDERKRLARAALPRRALPLRRHHQPVLRSQRRRSPPARADGRLARRSRRHPVAARRDAPGARRAWQLCGAPRRRPRVHEPGDASLPRALLRRSDPGRRLAHRRADPTDPIGADRSDADGGFGLVRPTGVGARDAPRAGEGAGEGPPVPDEAVQGEARRDVQDADHRAPRVARQTDRIVSYDLASWATPYGAATFANHWIGAGRTQDPSELLPGERYASHTPVFVGALQFCTDCP